MIRVVGASDVVPGVGKFEIAGVGDVKAPVAEAVGFNPEGYSVTAVPVMASPGWSVYQSISLAGGSV